MAARNPDAALEALTHTATTKVGRFEVRELFLGTMALLQRIGSPLLSTDAPATLEMPAVGCVLLRHDPSRPFVLEESLDVAGPAYDPLGRQGGDVADNA